MARNNNIYRSVLCVCISLVATLYCLPSHAIFLSGDLADCPVGTTDFNINHTQTTLDKELLFDCPFDSTDVNGAPLHHNFITRIYNITNDTGRDWQAYDLEVLLLEDGEAINFGWDTNRPFDGELNVMADVVYMGDRVWINFAQPLADGESFSGVFRYGEYSSGVARVNGIAKVPEPGTLVLLGLGLAGLGFARRKKAW